MRLRPCGGCARHVRLEEPCPFCGSTATSGRQPGTAPKRWLLAAAAAGGIGGSACPAYGAPVDDDAFARRGSSSSSGVTTSSSSSAGGSGGSTAWPCGTDCSVLVTDQCLEGVCNDGTYPGPVGSCVVAPTPGASCEDGLECSQNDVCDDSGTCMGGPGCGAGGAENEGGAGGQNAGGAGGA